MSKKSLQENNEIENKVMSKIKGEHLHMQSKAHFVILGIVSIIAIILAVILATYFISVLSLFIRLQIAQGPAYGVQRNLAYLLQTFPWQALLLGLLFIAAAIYLIIKSGKMYKIRLRYLVPTIIIAIFSIGLLLSFSSLQNLGNRNPSGNGSSVKGYRYNRK